jgi:ribonuclease R
VHIADVAHTSQSEALLTSRLSCEAIQPTSLAIAFLCCPTSSPITFAASSLNVIRLTVSVLVDFDKDGTMTSYRIVRSYIKSAKRFSYEEAKQVLDGETKSPHLDALKLMVELCHLLKNKRHERGSIDFALPELVIIVDEKDSPIKPKELNTISLTSLSKSSCSKPMKQSPKHLSEKGKPVVFRVHEAPDTEDFNDFYAMARSMGFSLPNSPSQRDIQALFEKAQKTPFAQTTSSPVLSAA